MRSGDPKADTVVGARQQFMQRKTMNLEKWVLRSDPKALPYFPPS